MSAVAGPVRARPRGYGGAVIDDVVPDRAGAARAHPLDDPVRAALTGPHAPLAERHGDALRYPVDVCPFLAPPRSADGWADAAVLVGAGTVVVPTTGPVESPGWTVERTLPGVQLLADGAEGADTGPPGADVGPEVLGPDDVPAMQDLVARTRPGPFAERTIVLGTYLGIRVGGALVAMAGERLHAPGHTEISAVCVDEGHRGRGLAARLVRTLAADIRARGEIPFLHATADNTPAIRLYERLGFRLRSRPDFVILRPPDSAAGPAVTESGEHPA